MWMIRDLLSRSIGSALDTLSGGREDRYRLMPLSGGDFGGFIPGHLLGSDEAYQFAFSVERMDGTIEHATGDYPTIHDGPFINAGRDADREELFHDRAAAAGQLHAPHVMPVAVQLLLNMWNREPDHRESYFRGVLEGVRSIDEAILLYGDEGMLLVQKAVMRWNPNSRYLIQRWGGLIPGTDHFYTDLLYAVLWIRRPVSSMRQTGSAA